MFPLSPKPISYGCLLHAGQPTKWYSCECEVNIVTVLASRDASWFSATWWNLWRFVGLLSEGVGNLQREGSLPARIRWAGLERQRFMAVSMGFFSWLVGCELLWWLIGTIVVVTSPWVSGTSYLLYILLDSGQASCEPSLWLLFSFIECRNRMYKYRIN